jgi:hypothetical protein
MAMYKGPSYVGYVGYVGPLLLPTYEGALVRRSYVGYVGPLLLPTYGGTYGVGFNLKRVKC